MMRKLEKQSKEVPLGLVYSNSAQAGYSAQSLPKSHTPILRKRPNLEGGPDLQKKNAPAPMPAPKRLPANLSEVVGYHNLRIVDIANNFPMRSSRENISKVYAAANSLGVKYRAVRPSASTGLFALNAASFSTRSSAPIPQTPSLSSKPSIRVGGPSVLSGLFGSPLSGTGLISRPSKMAGPSIISAPALRMAA